MAKFSYVILQCQSKICGQLIITSDITAEMYSVIYESLILSDERTDALTQIFNLILTFDSSHLTFYVTLNVKLSLTNLECLDKFFLDQIGKFSNLFTLLLQKNGRLLLLLLQNWMPLKQRCDSQLHLCYSD